MARKKNAVKVAQMATASSASAIITEAPFFALSGKPRNPLSKKPFAREQKASSEE